jgi:membrane protease YdiL (CAAX protease family)
MTNSPLPSRTPASTRFGPWSLLGLLFVAGIGGALTLTWAASVQTAFRGILRSVAWDRVTSDPVNLAFSQIIGVCAALWFGKVMYFREQPWSNVLRFRPAPRSTLALSLIAGCALQFPLTEIANLTSHWWPESPEHRAWLERLMTPATTRDAMIGFFSVVIVPPWTEELLFRGMSIEGLRQRYTARATVGMTALAFAMSHGSAHAILPALVAGLLFATVSYRTGSVLPSLLMHTGVNATPLLLPASVVRIPGFNMGLGAESSGQSIASPVHLPPVLLAGTLVVLALALMGVARTSRTELAS